MNQQENNLIKQFAGKDIKIILNEDGEPLFELYGVDILLDEKLNPWLMEVNLNPSLNCDSEIDLKIKSKLLTDIFNIIGAVPFSHDWKAETMDKEIKYETKVEEGVKESLYEFERPSGGFERIFPRKENIEYYAKFFSDNSATDDNIVIWQYVITH